MENAKIKRKNMLLSCQSIKIIAEIKVHVKIILHKGDLYFFCDMLGKKGKEDTRPK